MDVSDAALRKRARATHAAAMVGNVLVMQHLAQEHPKLIRRAERTRFSAWASGVSRPAQPVY
jgi:hypothetical protein